MNTQDVLNSLTTNEMRVLRERFGLDAEEKCNDQADSMIPPVDDGGDEGGVVYQLQQIHQSRTIWIIDRQQSANCDNSMICEL